MSVEEVSPGRIKVELPWHSKPLRLTLEVYKADFGGDETSFVDFVVCQLHTRNQTPGGNQAMVNWYLNRAAERKAQGSRPIQVRTDDPPLI